MAALQSDPLGRDPSINKDQVSLRLGDLHMTMAGGGGPTESILGSQGF